VLRRAAGFTIADIAVPVMSPLIAGVGAAGAYVLFPWHGDGWPGLIVGGTVIVVAYTALTVILYKVLPRSGAGAVKHGAGH
jgi:hypothetical protein